METTQVRTPIHYITVILWLTAVIVVLSWVLGAYGVAAIRPDTGEQVMIQSLISAEGLRWWLRTVVSNFMTYPGMGAVALFALSFGLAKHTGLGIALAQATSALLCRLLRRSSQPTARDLSTIGVLSVPLTRLEKNALLVTLTVVVAYIFLILLGILPHIGVLRSVDGGLLGGPFVQGLPFLLTLGLALAALTFGFTSRKYTSARHIIRGLAAPIPFLTMYLGTCFLCSLLFSFLAYSRIDSYCVIALANGLARLSGPSADPESLYAICQGMTAQFTPLKAAIPLVLTLWTWALYRLRQRN